MVKKTLVIRSLAALLTATPLNAQEMHDHNLDRLECNYEVTEDEMNARGFYPQRHGSSESCCGSAYEQSIYLSRLNTTILIGAVVTTVIILSLIHI